MTDHRPLSYVEEMSKMLDSGDAAIVFSDGGVMVVFSEHDRLDIDAEDVAALLSTPRQHVAVDLARFLQMHYPKMIVEAAHKLFALQTEGLATAPGPEGRQ